jgi:hypothetical protein
MFVTILVSAVGATTALAAKDARLQGKFDVTLTVRSSNVLAVGERVERTYKFTPLRPKGACGAVRLGREAGSGCCITSKFKRIGRGVCESTEQNLNLTCADGSEVPTGRATSTSRSTGRRTVRRRGSAERWASTGACMATSRRSRDSPHWHGPRAFCVRECVCMTQVARRWTYGGVPAPPPQPTVTRMPVSTQPPPAASA